MKNNNEALKPCMNVDCIGHDIKWACNCIEMPKVHICPKYTPEPKESAWELFRKLRSRLQYLYVTAQRGSIKEEIGSRLAELTDVLDSPEPDALKILKEIEKEIEG